MSDEPWEEKRTVLVIDDDEDFGSQLAMQLQAAGLTGVAAETGLDFSATSEAERSRVKADAMLSKPVRFEQLQREIDRLLRR